MLSRRRVLQAASATLLAGCSPIRLVNGLAPSDTYRAERGVRFGAHPRLVLDIYHPVPQREAAPVVVFFYGGHWKSGERGDYLFVGEALAAKGCVAVIPDYRLYPEVRFPAFLEDCAQAAAWALVNLGSRGVFLMGHSAGAYNAAMLALDPRYLQAAGADRARVRGLIGLAGPYDFLPLSNETDKAVFGFPDTPPETQPIRFAGRGAPPALLATGDEDKVVRPENTRRLAARLRESGVRVRERIYPGLSHIMIAGALAAPLRWRASVGNDIAAFIAETA